MLSFRTVYVAGYNTVQALQYLSRRLFLLSNKGDIFAWGKCRFVKRKILTLFAQYALSLGRTPWRSVSGCQHIFCRLCLRTISKCPQCRQAITGLNKPHRILVNMADDERKKRALCTVGECKPVAQRPCLPPECRRPSTAYIPTVSTAYVPTVSTAYVPTVSTAYVPTVSTAYVPTVSTAATNYLPVENAVAPPQPRRLPRVAPVVSTAVPSATLGDVCRALQRLGMSDNEISKRAGYCGYNGRRDVSRMMVNKCNNARGRLDLLINALREKLQGARY